MRTDTLYSIDNEKLRTEVYRWETTRNVKREPGGQAE
jgi:hypothetical protein